MILDIDIYLSATIIKKRYGGDASIHAAMRADTMLAATPSLGLAGATVELWQIVSYGIPGRHRSCEDMVVTAAARVVVQRPEGNNSKVTFQIHARHGRSAAPAEDLREKTC